MCLCEIKVLGCKITFLHLKDKRPKIYKYIDQKPLRLRLGVHKGREWNGIIIREWKEMKRNGMYLSKGKEWN